MISKFLQILGLQPRISFSQTLEQFFLTVCQNNFNNKIPLSHCNSHFDFNFNFNFTCTFFIIVVIGIFHIFLFFLQAGGGMGLSIVAAKGVGKDKLGIYVKAVVDNGAAHHDGKLKLFKLVQTCSKLVQT